MKLPFLPIHIDSFVKSSEAVCFAEDGSVGGGHALYFLSHAHTDHMAGLTPHWQGGLLLCSEITREVLLQKMEEEAHRHGGGGGRGPHDRRDPTALCLADRCVSLPLWQRIPLLSTTPPPLHSATIASQDATDATSSSVDSNSSSSVQLLAVSGPGSAAATAAAAAAVYVTLLPAFHIPGSVMFYFETPCGRLLYTGDFKFDPASAAPVLTAFFQRHPVDHVYLDDTWLHLGISVSTQTYAEQEAAVAGSSPAPDNTGTKVLSKLLNAAQVEEAVEAIGRRLDAQRRHFDTEMEDYWSTLTDAGDEEGEEEEGDPPLPFVLRVYLHNQFGKEMLVQRIAERLGTRALLDDNRFARIAIVSAVLNSEDVDDGRGCGEENDDDIAAAFRQDTSLGTEPSSSLSPRRHVSSREEEEERGPVHSEDPVAGAAWKERDFYRLDLCHFISHSEHRQLLSEIRRLRREARQEHAPREEREKLLRRARELVRDLPLVEVVDTRAKISPEALEKAAARSPGRRRHRGTPHYGVVMSGWARLQSTRQQTSEVWQVPTTLHCTPQEIIDFIALLRPRSVTPLHYRASRSPAAIMQRLGPHLRRPFVNEFIAGDASSSAEWTPMASSSLSGQLPFAGGRDGRRVWYGLLPLPDSFLRTSVGLPHHGAMGGGRLCYGLTEDAMAFLGPRQRGYKIAASSQPHEADDAERERGGSGSRGGGGDPRRGVAALDSHSSSDEADVDTQRTLCSQEVNLSCMAKPSPHKAHQRADKRRRESDGVGLDEEGVVVVADEEGSVSREWPVSPALTVEAATDVLLDLVSMLESQAP